MVAGVTDSAAVYYNPAAMTELEKYGAKAGFQFVDPKTKYDGSGGGAQTGNETFSIPHIYSVKKLKDMGIAVGLGIFSNFGAGTNWAYNSPLRYDATDTKLRTTTVNLAGAMSLGIASVGLGLDYMTAKVNYNNMYPFKGIGADGYSVMDGSGSSFGFNAGLLLKATDAIKVGASYRSAMSTKLKGSIEIQNFPSPLLPLLASKGISGDRYSSGAETTINFPAMASLGVNINVTNALSLEVDADFTQWSSYEKLDFTFASPLSSGSATLLPASATKSQKWKDVTAIRVGGAFKHDEHLTLRLGYCNDPSPVPDATFSPRIPDADRSIYSAGLSYAASDKYVVDASFAYVAAKDRTIANGGSVDGTYKTSANVFGVSVGYKF
jgi:long-chain fatty acid transport protein